ncbi:hypothetical protein AAGU66_16485 [Edwardsiella ictaluri]|uniref:hypothetical protein n=1 Tax=Edwardsiella ictaluri TaxID=67780 RepID=UPI00065D873E|nr:hypothetical protein [Edwardsiella ictaluri]EKS7762781.1 hypothetical protein [Edwardsiella ictaluri]EKS7789497.1 hypothetical protein [Edwardsiella ictaluri]EKS7819631.1 hypothetical protein [Edwardsiella ictaluri]EKS7822996.1 hypothetical protein [Edwardsiella ictaluri]EKS7826350.1 hypothetical protein [Edwardsiella ictaluri]
MARNDYSAAQKGYQSVLIPDPQNSDVRLGEVETFGQWDPRCGTVWGAVRRNGVALIADYLEGKNAESSSLR